MPEKFTSCILIIPLTYPNPFSSPVRITIIMRARQGSKWHEVNTGGATQELRVRTQPAMEEELKLLSEDQISQSILRLSR